MWAGRGAATEAEGLWCGANACRCRLPVVHHAYNMCILLADMGMGGGLACDSLHFC